MSCSVKIAIASGKGGTGKTLVATNLTYALNNAGYDITLVDCDAEEPNAKVFFDVDLENEISVKQRVPVIDKNACVFCGKCHEYCNYNAIFFLPGMDIINVVEDLCHSCGACSVACKYNAISEKDKEIGTVSYFPISENSLLVEACMNVGVYSAVPVITKALDSLNSNRSYIFDSPPGTSCPFIHTVLRADFVILVTEPTNFGLHDLKQSVETLRLMDIPCGVIINRAGIGDNVVFDYLEKENIDVLMEIPFEKEIAFYYSWGEIIAKNRQQWSEELINMFDSICKKYGNSSN
ncbi:MAG: P-loop NTPase [Bacteroidota bacterium]